MLWEENILKRLRGEVTLSSDNEGFAQQVRILRAPIPSGRLLGFSYDSLPRGIHFIEAKDLKGKNQIELPFGNLPLLAEEDIRYIGQPVALVCADDPEYLDSFLQNIEVIYEETRPQYFSKTPYENQIIEELNWQRGSSKEAMTQAEYVIEGEYRTQGQGIAPVTPLGAMAQIQDDHIYLHFPTPWIEGSKNALKQILPSHFQIHIKNTADSYPWDSGLWYSTFLACLTAAAANLTGRSSYLELSSDETYLYGPHRAPMSFHYKTGFDKNGRLLAMEVDCAFDSGAFTLCGREILHRALLASGGLYYCKHVKLTGIAVQTSSPPRSPYLNFGVSEGSYARELHFARVAEVLQQDYAVFSQKLMNNTNFRFLTGGFTKEGPAIANAIQSTMSKSDYLRKNSAYELLRKRRLTPWNEGVLLKGIGFSSGFQGNAFLFPLPKTGILDVSLNSTGIEVTPRVFWNEPHVEDYLNQLGAQVFALDEENLFFTQGDKEVDGGPKLLGRNISVTANQIEQAFNNIQKRRFREGLPISVKKKYRRSNRRILDSEKFSGLPFHDTSWGAASVEIEINPITLDYKVQDIWMTIEAGKILHHNRAKEALRAAALGAINWCLYQDFTEDNFTFIYPCYQNYFNLPMESIPDIHIQFVETSEKAKPKSIGELPWILIPPALAQGISQALGHKMDSLPMGRKNIKTFLENR